MVTPLGVMLENVGNLTLGKIGEQAGTDGRLIPQAETVTARIEIERTDFGRIVQHRPVQRIGHPAEIVHLTTLRPERSDQFRLVRLVVALEIVHGLRFEHQFGGNGQGTRLEFLHPFFQSQDIGHAHHPHIVVTTAVGTRMTQLAIITARQIVAYPESIIGVQLTGRHLQDKNQGTLFTAIIVKIEILCHITNSYKDGTKDANCGNGGRWKLPPPANPVSRRPRLPKQVPLRRRSVPRCPHKIHLLRKYDL